MKKLILAALLLVALNLALSPVLTAQNSKKAEGRTPVLVLLKTNQGDITLELDAKNAPVSTENFLTYVKSGHYNGTIFHRVIADFMIQGGGFEQGMKEKTTNAPIKNEAQNGLKNDVYTVAMARTSDPHSATSQFFINTKDNEFLNFTSEDMRGWGYAVFGKVIKGQEVIDKIKVVKTTSVGFYDDVPVEPVIIEEASVINE